MFIGDGMSLTGTAIEEAVKWAVPVGLTGLLAWGAVKRKAIANRLRKRRQRRESRDAMLDSWPTVTSFIADAADREEKTAAREIRVTAEFKAIRDILSKQDGALDRIAAQLWGQMKLDPQARFQCTPEGRNEQVNAAYAAIMRVGEFELMGFGWKNRIYEPDRREYEAAATQAFREHRKFERSVRFQRGDGSVFMGHVRIEPYPEDPAELSDGRKPLWFGSVIVVEDLP